MREEYEELDEEEENDVDETSNKKKNLIITSIVSLSIVLCIAIGISLAPKHSSTSTNYNHQKDKFTNSKDIIKIDNDISHFLKADTTEVRSEIGSNTCPSGEGLWNMKLVTDLYGYETDWALYDASSNERIAHGPPEPYNYEDLTTYQGNLCLPYGDYYIKWMDMSADGICCDFGMGSWTVKVNNNMMLQSTPDDNYKEKDHRFSVGTNENLDRDNFAVSVNTQLGLFVGTNNDERFTNTDFVTNGVDSFLGIKYGRIPGRFRKSQLYEQRRDFIDATDFGPFCWQSVDMPWYEDQQQSEDCLYLNMWRPRGTSPTSKLAVMVYLHGGGLNYGGSAEPPSYGHNLAVKGNVIVVNINFRLGVFGFMSTDNNGSNGMNGIYDQIVALRWLRKYIGNFGGDKNRVTLFGLGSGSASVCWLSVSPAARGLFQRAIMSSGECAAGSSGNRPGQHGLLSPQEGFAITQSIQNTYGALSVDDLRNPNLYPASDIYNARVMGDPILDRAVLQGYPQYLYRNPNNINPFQMIVGSTTYADEQLVPPSPFGSDVATDLNAFYQIIQDDWPGVNVNRLKNAYSPQNHYGGSVMNAQTQYEGDVQSFCDTRQFASYVSEGISGRVYLYQYGALTSYDAVSLRGLFNEFTNTAGNQWASFGSDLVMVFGTYKQVSNQWWYTSTNTPWDGVTAAELAVSNELMSRWSSFAKSGNPNNNMYQGWSSVPKTGPNYDGQASQINQFYFSLNLGGFMSSSALLDDVIRRCGSFPNWPAFAINTPKPTRRPTKHPTTYHPTLFPTLAPSLSPTWAPTLSPVRPTKRPTKRPTMKPSTTRPTTTSPSTPRPSTIRPTTKSPVTPQPSPTSLTPPPTTSQPSKNPTVNPSTDRLRMLIDEPADSDSDSDSDFDHILV